MKLVLYGLTEISELVRKSIRDENEIVAYTDSFANIDMYKGINFVKVNEIINLSFDYVIICIAGKEGIVIRQNLIDNGIFSDKIIVFLEIFSGQKVDKLFGEEKQNIDGIVIGMSYALYGIRTELFPGYWKNLAVTSEDIFYHWKMVDILKRRYAGVVENIKYAIIDLWEPVIFNWDVSLSRAAITYYGNGGIVEDLHNYTNNSNFHNNLKDELEKIGLYYSIRSEKELQIRSNIFDEQYVFKQLGKINSGYAYKLGYNDVPYVYQYGSPNMERDIRLYFKIYEKEHENTVKENIKYFNFLIQTLKSINPQIKLIYLLMPRFYKVEKMAENSLQVQKCKGEFDMQITKIVKFFGGTYLDLQKSIKGISDNLHFWHDPVHLNFFGGNVFSSYLINYLKKINFWEI